MLILYGGSFNPPTKAHLNIIISLTKNYPEALIKVIPVGNDYQKKSLIESRFRIDMLNLLVKNINNVEISRFEIDNPYQGTLKTYEYFKTLDEEVFYVIGSDQIVNLDKWINYEELIHKVKFIVYRRDFDNVDELFIKYQNLNPRYLIMDTNFIGKSTFVRNNINEYKYMLTEEVYNYITNNNLYRIEE